MLILAIDPSLNNFGWVLVESDHDRVVDYGVLNPRSNERMVMFNFFHRLRHLRRELGPCLKQAEGVALEISSGSKSAAAARSLIGVAGFLAGVIPESVPFMLVTPKRAKSVVPSEEPYAGKVEIVYWAKEKHPEITWGDIPAGKHEHIADALTVYHSCKNDLLRARQTTGN